MNPHRFPSKITSLGGYEWGIWLTLDAQYSPKMGLKWFWAWYIYPNNVIQEPLKRIATGPIDYSLSNGPENSMGHKSACWLVLQIECRGSIKRGQKRQLNIKQGVREGTTMNWWICTIPIWMIWQWQIESLFLLWRQIDISLLENFDEEVPKL
jgi:hypothetical protein